VSRTLSPQGLAGLFAQETDEAFLLLLTLSHEDLPAPIRVSSDAVNTTSRGQLYVAYPFDLTLPDDADDHAPRARLTIDNVSREIVLAVRSIGSPLAVKIEIVRAAAPDVVEIAYSGDLLLRNVSYDDLVVAGDLAMDDDETEPFPAIRFTPATVPGLF
jgi:hypothetical protein